MNVLLICGTGAIGSALAEVLSKQGHSIYVTTRRNLKSGSKNVYYLQGDSKDSAFLSVILSKGHWDAIVDFGHYDTKDMQRWMPIFQMSTEHFIFVSSSRVYAPSSERITEKTLRQADLPDFQIPQYGAAYQKAFGEQLLKSSWLGNWTIVRPYITYNVSRLQLGIYEIEWWLQRLLDGAPIVIPRAILSCRTTMTYAGDTAKRIAGILGRKEAKGEIFQIASPEHHTWQEVLDFYLGALSANRLQPAVYVTDDDAYVDYFFDRDQYEHDRLYDRIFDSSKIDSVSGCHEYTPLKDGLTMCLEKFLVGDRLFAERENYRQWGIYIEQRVLWKECKRYENGENFARKTGGAPKRKIICFGAGRRMQETADYLKNLYEILFIVDNDKKKWGSSMAGIEIKAPAELKEYQEVLCVVTADNVKEAFLMMNQVRNYGMEKVEHLRNMIK